MKTILALIYSLTPFRILTFAGLIAFYSCASEKPEKLNVLLIIADDLGWKDLTCYGSEFYETPNIDRIAKLGTRFTNAYMSPVCSPSRASIMTGKYPVKHGITEWIGAPQPYEVMNDTGWHSHLVPARYFDRLPLEEITIAELFRSVGYRTFFAGKWYLGPEGFWPEDQGFDINKGGHSAGFPRGSGYFSPYDNPRLSNGEPGEHLPIRLANETARFLKSAGNDPFFATLAFYIPHVPLQAPDELIRKYEEKRDMMTLEQRVAYEGDIKVRQTQDHPVYAAMIEWLDNAVGIILDELERLKLADNTIVIFVSDNGGLSLAGGSPTSNYPLRAGKGWLYEGGIRVPLIINAPHIPDQVEVCHEPVNAIDLLPTILNLTGMEYLVSENIDGVDISPLLNEGVIDRQAIFWHYPHFGNQGGWPGAVVRSGDYKLIEKFETGDFELYNLREDIGEKNNLYLEKPEVRDELILMLRKWQQENNVVFPEPAQRLITGSN